MLGIKRALTNGAAYTLGLGISTDVAASTVIRWELRLRAALQASMKKFIELCYGEMELGRVCSPGLRLALHAIRGDATNANMLEKCKLHVAMVECAFILEPIKAETPWDVVYAGLEYKRAMADLHKMRPGLKAQAASALPSVAAGVLPVAGAESGRAPSGSLVPRAVTTALSLFPAPSGSTGTA
jgi:hypothetical protein